MLGSQVCYPYHTHLLVGFGLKKLDVLCLLAGISYCRCFHCRVLLVSWGEALRYPGIAALCSLVGAYFPPTAGPEQVPLPPYRLHLVGQDEAC